MPIIERETPKKPPTQQELPISHGLEEASTDVAQEEPPTSSESLSSSSNYLFTLLLGLLIPLLLFGIYKFGPQALELLNDDGKPKYDEQSLMLSVDSLQRLNSLRNIAKEEFDSNAAFLEEAKQKSAETTIETLQRVTDKNQADIASYKKRITDTVLMIGTHYHADSAATSAVMQQLIKQASLSGASDKERMLKVVSDVVQTLPTDISAWGTYVSEAIDGRL